MRRGFQVTKRDLKILKALYDFKYLDSKQITRVIAGSDDFIKRRLQKLTTGDFIKRHKKLISSGKREFLIYTLTKRGAEILGWSYGFTRGIVFPVERDSPHIEHALLVSETLLSFRVGAELRNESFRPFSAPLRASDDGFFEVNVAGGDYRVVPDAIFSVGKMNFFLEADRGTMPVLRSDFDRSSIMKKLILYREMFKQGKHKEKRFDNFRILFVTSSQRRIDSMIATLKKLGGPSGLFLFTTQERIKSEDPLSVGWQSVRGDQRIMPERSSEGR